jgi:hypothetical protein
VLSACAIQQFEILACPLRPEVAFTVTQTGGPWGPSGMGQGALSLVVRPGERQSSSRMAPPGEDHHRGVLPHR